MSKFTPGQKVVLKFANPLLEVFNANNTFSDSERETKAVLLAENVGSIDSYVNDNTVNVRINDQVFQLPEDSIEPQEEEKEEETVTNANAGADVNANAGTEANVGADANTGVDANAGNDANANAAAE